MKRGIAFALIIAGCLLIGETVQSIALAGSLVLLGGLMT